MEDQFIDVRISLTDCINNEKTSVQSQQCSVNHPALDSVFIVVARSFLWLSGLMDDSIDTEKRYGVNGLMWTYVKLPSVFYACLLIYAKLSIPRCDLYPEYTFGTLQVCNLLLIPKNCKCLCLVIGVWTKMWLWYGLREARNPEQSSPEWAEGCRTISFGIRQIMSQNGWLVSDTLRRLKY